MVSRIVIKSIAACSVPFGLLLAQDIEGTYHYRTGNPSLENCDIYRDYTIIITEQTSGLFDVVVSKHYAPPFKVLNFSTVANENNGEIRFDYSSGWCEEGEGMFYKEHNGLYSLTLECSEEIDFEARALFGETLLLKQTNNTANHYNSLAEKYYKNSEYQKAYEILSALSATYPDNERAKGNLVITQIKRGEYRSAEFVAHQLLYNTSNDNVKASSYYNLGLAKEKQDQLDSAIYYYSESNALRSSESLTNKIKNLQNTVNTKSKLSPFETFINWLKELF